MRKGQNDSAVARALSLPVVGRLGIFVNGGERHKQGAQYSIAKSSKTITWISSEIRTKVRDWAVGQVRDGCYSQAAMS